MVVPKSGTDVYNDGGREVTVTTEILGDEPDGDLTWLVGDGEEVEAGQPIAEIETGKVTLEVLSPSSGVLRILLVEGALVEVGVTIGVIS